MKINQQYSHLHGEEYFITHHAVLYKEIQEIISGIKPNLSSDSNKVLDFKNNVLKIEPTKLNKYFYSCLYKKGWSNVIYDYYESQSPFLNPKTIFMSAETQKKFLQIKGENAPILSYSQIDFVKDKISIQPFFDLNAISEKDLWKKYILFYNAGLINLGIEIFPMKKLQTYMGSGGYYEREVDKLRQSRNNPPVPLLILGVEP